MEARVLLIRASIASHLMKFLSCLWPSFLHHLVKL